MLKGNPRLRLLSTGSAIAIAGAAVLGTIGYQGVVRYGRMLLRLRAIEEQLHQLIGREGATLGLYKGRVVIEDFDLPELRGGRMSLSQLRGNELVCVFFDPTSGPCQQMVPALSELSRQSAIGKPLLVIISTGDVETNQAVLRSQGLDCPILLQEDWEVGMLFDVRVTPLAYRLDEDGRVASAPAVGVAAIFALASVDGPAPYVQTQITGPLATRAPTYLTADLDGLLVGTRAPYIRVPLLGGGELSLSAYRGRHVLLVFWDPQYGPCLPLATHLESIHRSQSELAIVMISRGSNRQNQEIVSELGITLPIGLQRHWEVSREFQVFATPVAYLINSSGIIVQHVAIGAEAILALASEFSPD